VVTSSKAPGTGSSVGTNVGTAGGQQTVGPGKSTLTGALGNPPAPTTAPADAARDLAPNERVLSKDPSYAAAGYVGWFATQLKTKIEAWDLAFDPSAVSLATVNLDGKPTKAVVLAWNAAWGTIPITRDFPLSMGPADAPAALSAIHGLAGWAKVPASDHGTIDAVLGGEENMQSAAARDHFRPTFKAVKAKKDDEQATALKGVLNTKDTTPGWSAEPMNTAVATVTVAGPAAHKDYDFNGQKADAEEWIATYSDGINVKIVSPKAPTPGYHNHSVQEVAEAAGFMPKSARAVITVIMLNPIVNPDDAHWAVTYHKPDFHSYMTAGAAGVVTIYPDKATNALPDNNGRRSAMVHETGHTWSFKNWGEDKTKGKWLEWKKAMDADKVAVSGYATNDIAEDVAETCRVYVSSKGTARYKEYKAMVPNRFAILKAEYDK